MFSSSPQVISPTFDSPVELLNKQYLLIPLLNRLDFISEEIVREQILLVFVKIARFTTIQL